jgi:hypothetical protein
VEPERLGKGATEETAPVKQIPMVVLVVVVEPEVSAVQVQVLTGAQAVRA